MNRQARRRAQKRAIAKAKTDVEKFVAGFGAEKPATVKKVLTRAVITMVTTRERYIVIRVSDEEAAAFPSYAQQVDLPGRWYLGVSAAPRLFILARLQLKDEYTEREKREAVQQEMIGILKAEASSGFSA